MQENPLELEKPKIRNIGVRVGSLNVNGMNQIADRQHVYYLQKQYEIDILCIQEPHVN